MTTNLQRFGPYTLTKYMTIDSPLSRPQDYLRPEPLYRLTQAAARARQPDDIYDAALDCLRDSLGVERAAILLFDEGGVMRFRAWRGLSEVYRSSVDGHSPWTKDVQEPEPVLIEDVALDESLGHLRQFVEAEGIAALAFIPLWLAGRLLGKFMLYYGEPHTFEGDEITFAQTIASQVAFAIDHEEHRRDLDELRETRDRKQLYEEIFRHALEGIAVISAAGVYLEQNLAHSLLTGLRDEDLAAQTPAIHLGHETFGRIAGELAATGRFRGDVVSHTKEGVPLILDLSAFAVRDENGETKYYVGMKHDVTERQKSHDAALELAAIVNSSRDAIVSKDLDGVIKTWNPGAEQIFGYTAAEAVGRSIRMIIPADRQHEEDEVLARIRSGQPVEHFETVRQRKDGSFVDISLTVSPVRDVDGRIVGASKIARDITDQKAAEEALRQSIALKDQFLSLISHELRTPLATIYGSSRLLRERFARIPDADRMALLNDVVVESQRLQRIIENLLLLTRLDIHGIELEPVLLERIVQKSIETVRSRHNERRITLHTDDSVPPVLANPTYVELVIDNLISNAIKYSAADAEVDVEIHGGERVEVRVLDRGIGLDENDREELFTPFFRAKNARGWASGVGVGLAVCKRVTEAQGGEIWARSRDGGGSEFGFALLPVSDTDTDS